MNVTKQTIDSSILFKLLKFCIDQRKFDYKLNDLLKAIWFKKYSYNRLLDTLKALRFIFKIDESDPRDVCFKIEFSLRLCKVYGLSNRCIQKCSNIHICLDCDEKKCRLDHHFYSKHNTALLEKYAVDSCHKAVLEFYKVRVLFFFFK